ncbi:MAG: endonuclease/exonuclease/phosphatase family protein [Alphaproteobacteria bacterium]
MSQTAPETATPELADRRVDRLALPSAAEREAMRTARDDAHAELYRSAACLHEVEARPADAAARPALRVVAWNAERCKHVGPSADLLRAAGADVALMTEMDDGMARSGQQRTLCTIADALGAGYAFAVEYVELGLGDAREQAWHAGEANRNGLHGNGILAAAPMRRPAVLRLEASGRWFVADKYQKRVGGRIATVAEVALGDAWVAMAAVHFESQTDRADRAAQMRTLVAGMQRYARDLPWLIGGDFNTNSFDIGFRQVADAVLAEALAADPYRLTDPSRHEPMFEVAAAAGLDWSACNLAHATTMRTLPDGRPTEPFAKIDWFFSRGLACSDPAVIPAVDAAGAAISDHEAIAVTIAVA